MRLGEVVTVSKGKKPDLILTEARPGYRRLIQIDDLRPGATSKFCPPTGNEVWALPTDVIIAWDGANAATSGFGLSGVIGSTLAILRPRSEEVFTPFLGHFVRSRERYLRDKCKGATVPHIDGRILADVEVDLPPLPEQRRIAAILDKADALRVKRRAALAQLDRLTQSIFLDMFGDPAANPMRWPQEYLETFFRFRTGKLDSNAAVANGRYPFFTCSREDFRIDTFAFDCEALLLAGNNASADYSVKYYKGKFNAYQRTYVITLRNERNSYAYSRFVLEHRLAELKRVSKGTGTKYLTMELLNRIRFPVPPQQLQDEFAIKVGEVEELEIVQRASQAGSDALFASLQHRAFRGEL